MTAIIIGHIGIKIFCPRVINSIYPKMQSQPNSAGAVHEE
jgi:hypothetical protein